MLKTENRKLFSGELWEANWRLWAFLLILVLSVVALYLYRITGMVNGYTDPFYSPTLAVIPLIALFRLSCYAYRKDYYRHIFRHPLACADGERFDSEKRTYKGETGFFLLNNFHRYFFYIGLAILPFFYWDFYLSLTYIPGYFVLRLGSIILLGNALLLTLWTVSCHAFRHIAGGYIDCYNCKAGGKGIKKFYNAQSRLNLHHEQLAFLSLLVVVGVDLYIRAVLMGLPVDFTFIKVLF